MFRVQCFQHTFKLVDLKGEFGDENLAVYQVFMLKSAFWFGSCWDQNKTVPVPSRYIEGLPDHLDSFTLTSL